MRGGFLHGWRGGGAPANWGRWGQLASGERSLKEGGEDREACQSRSRQMSGQLPQDPSASPPPPAHRMLTSFHPLPKLANVLFSACTLQTPATPNSAHFHAMNIRRATQCCIVLGAQIVGVHIANVLFSSSSPPREPSPFRDLNRGDQCTTAPENIFTSIPAPAHALSDG